MRSITRLSIGLIAISLALPLWSAIALILFVQPERAQIAAGELHYMFSYENFVHEAGFARLAISILALFIVFVPYRKGERWAFAAMVILAITYYIPVFRYGAIPNLGTWPLFHNWNLPQNRVSNPVLEYWSSLVLTALLILGLIVSAPAFFRKNSSLGA